MAYEGLFEELPKGSLSDIIVQRITDALISGELKPGDKIPTETEFAENLGVGRNAVREAIKVLVAFGVLEIRRAKGTYVVEDYNDKLLDPLIYGVILTQHSMDELLDVKIGLATATTYLALKNATDEEVVELRRLGEEFARVMADPVSTDEQCYKASIAFNVHLSEMGHNRLLAQLEGGVRTISNFVDLGVVRACRAAGDVHPLVDSYREQVAIVENRRDEELSAFADRRGRVMRGLLIEE